MRNKDARVKSPKEMAVAEQENAIGLPASLELAWGLRERPAKGPKRALSVERIVEAGVALAEAEGLGAVSMSRVAAELGSKPMSLYRYIGSKDELVTLMVDAAAQPLASGPEGESWREGLTRWCWGYRDLLQRHAWILRVPISGPPLTPNQLFFLERGLQALGGTTLLENEKMSVMLLLSGFVRNEATLMADIAAAAEATGNDAREIMPSYGKLVGRLIDPVRFPALQQVLDAGVFDQDDEEDDEFNFGLERILDGVELLMRARS